MPQKDDHIRA